VKLNSKPNFQDAIVFPNNLMAMKLSKTTIKYNKPNIVGMCILDLAKTVMYDFHYNFIKPLFGNKARLCFTDTDSFAYHIEHPDIYKVLKEHSSIFDLSGYPKLHPTYDPTNKKVIGKMKDEYNGRIITEFIGLRSKMYSLTLEPKSELHQAQERKEADDKRAKKIARGDPDLDESDDEDVKPKAKGIKKSVKLTHEEFVKTINNPLDKHVVKFHAFRSNQHQLTTQEIHKTGLSAYDDKRYVLDDNINTLAHGHWRIPVSA
jgi:hypothetical protein